MREIKFRAWDKTSKVMVRGVQGNWYLRPDGIPVSIDHDGEEEKIGDYELMQFTGLKDKNGKEIYEGDIVKTEGFILKVIWYERAACFRYLDNAHNLLSPLNYDDPEIIGNIYENPELLTL